MLREIGAALSLEVTGGLNLFWVSYLAQKPQFHIPRKCLIRRDPNSQFSLPTNTCLWARLHSGQPGGLNGSM